MKKQLPVIIGLIVVLALGVVIWKQTRTNTRDLNLNRIHGLEHVLTYAEQKGANYAADRLDYLITYSYTKDDLRKKWGLPNESAEDADIWELSDEFQLRIAYGADEQVWKVEVVSK